MEEADAEHVVDYTEPHLIQEYRDFEIKIRSACRGDGDRPHHFPLDPPLPELDIEFEKEVLIASSTNGGSARVGLSWRHDSCSSARIRRTL